MLFLNTNLNFKSLHGHCFNSLIIIVRILFRFHLKRVRSMVPKIFISSYVVVANVQQVFRIYLSDCLSCKKNFISCTPTASWRFNHKSINEWTFVNKCIMVIDFPASIVKIAMLQCQAFFFEYLLSRNNPPFLGKMLSAEPREEFG